MDGKEVMQFSYAAISEENNGAPFLVKKHSRFRSYPLHVHDWVELSYMYSGSCVQVINDTEYEMKQGQLMLMSPGIVHTFFYFLPKAVGGFGSSSQNFSVSGMNLLQHLTIC